MLQTIYFGVIFCSWFGMALCFCSLNFAGAHCNKVLHYAQNEKWRAMCHIAQIQKT
jgi:hypothetical protein